MTAGEHGLCGFVINTIDIADRNSSMFFKRVLDGMRDELARHGFDLVIFPGPSGEDMLDYLRRVVERRHIDGVAIAETLSNDPRINYLSMSGIPFVTFGKSGTPGPYTWVDIDFPGMVRDAVSRFHAKGHRKIAISVPRLDLDLYYSNACYVEYQAAIAELGLEFRPDYVFISGENMRDNGWKIAQTIVDMADPPTAIVNLDDEISPGISESLIKLNRVPGQDLAILGVVPEPQAGMQPSFIGGYWFNLEGIGHAIATNLLSSIAHTRDSSRGAPGNVVYPLTYLDGESAAFGPRSLA